MVVRRIFFRWQYYAAVILPLWVFVGWGVFGPDGWPFIVVLFVCPVLAVGLLVVGLLNFARASVRRERSLSWLDVLLLSALHLCLLGIGFYGSANSWLILLAVALGLATFWASAWQLATDATRRASQTFRQASIGGEARPRPRRASDDPIIIVHETDR